MFTAAKDAITSKTAQIFLNEQIARYGRVDQLRIDSGQKTLEVVCQLNGETSPIQVNVGNYVVTGDGAQKFIELSQYTCSRPWLQTLLEDYTAGRRYPLPGWAAVAL
jgi:hypothetical protein